LSSDEYIRFIYNIIIINYIILFPACFPYQNAGSQKGTQAFNFNFILSFFGELNLNQVTYHLTRSNFIFGIETPSFRIEYGNLIRFTKYMCVIYNIN
jgi:hypothetical protein